MDALNEIEKVKEDADLIFPRRQVDQALDRMAEAITNLLSEQNPLFLSVMNGGIITAALLMLRMPFTFQLDSIFVSRYRNTTRGNEIQWLKKPGEPIRDRVVLLIDDILDEGITLAEIKDYCLKQGAKSVFTAVLVDKMLDIEKPITADFVGLTCENRYLFGYGMDYKGYLRNAPGIFACPDETSDS